MKADKWKTKALFQSKNAESNLVDTLLNKFKDSKSPKLSVGDIQKEMRTYPTETIMGHTVMNFSQGHFLKSEAFKIYRDNNEFEKREQ